MMQRFSSPNKDFTFAFSNPLEVATRHRIDIAQERTSSPAESSFELSPLLRDRVGAPPKSLLHETFQQGPPKRRTAMDITPKRVRAPLPPCVSP